MLFKIFVSTTLCIAVAGCAGLNVGPVSKVSPDKDRGIRFYQPAPYLFIRSDGKGGLISEIIYLPDTTLTMSAKPYAYFASNDTTLNFTNGTLNEAKMIGDETVVPTAIVDALGKAAAAVVGADQAGASGRMATVPVPYLFRIKVHADRIELIGGQAAAKDKSVPMLINVMLVPQAPAK